MGEEWSLADQAVGLDVAEVFAVIGVEAFE